jgi:hypothetical protein
MLQFGDACAAIMQAGGPLRSGASSPARRAVAANHAALKSDLDGQPRTGPGDLGSDQLSSAPVVRRPLAAADVGPAWYKR